MSASEGRRPEAGGGTCIAPLLDIRLPAPGPQTQECLSDQSLSDVDEAGQQAVANSWDSSPDDLSTAYNSLNRNDNSPQQTCNWRPNIMQSEEDFEEDNNERENINGRPDLLSELPKSIKEELVAPDDWFPFSKHNSIFEEEEEEEHLPSMSGPSTWSDNKQLVNLTNEEEEEEQGQIPGSKLNFTNQLSNDPQNHQSPIKQSIQIPSGSCNFAFDLESEPSLDSSSSCYIDVTGNDTVSSYLTSWGDPPPPRPITKVKARPHSIASGTPETFLAGLRRHDPLRSTIARLQRHHSAINPDTNSHRNNTPTTSDRLSLLSSDEDIDWSWVVEEEQRRPSAPPATPPGNQRTPERRIQEDDANMSSAETPPIWQRSSMRRLQQLELMPTAAIEATRRPRSAPTSTPGGDFPRRYSLMGNLRSNPSNRSSPSAPLGPPPATPTPPQSLEFPTDSLPPELPEPPEPPEPSEPPQPPQPPLASPRTNSESSLTSAGRRGSFSSDTSSSSEETPPRNGNNSGANEASGSGNTGGGGGAGNTGNEFPTNSSSAETSSPEAEGDLGTSSPFGCWPHELSAPLATLGCTLGLFNVSRFAILSLHFGATFILQFILLSFALGIPLHSFHVAMGQHLSSGLVDMWVISPVFRGIGIAILIAHALIGVYTLLGISWMFVYFRDSFITHQDLYRWAEPFPIFRDTPLTPTTATTTAQTIYSLSSHSNNHSWNLRWPLEQTVPDYLSGVVLQRHTLAAPGASSEASLGHLKFQLTFNLAIAWMIVFVCLSKGLKSYGKVVFMLGLGPVIGFIVFSTKMLGLAPARAHVMNHHDEVFPETNWPEFFINSRSWLAACSECFLTWGLLGAAAMQIASHTKQRRPGLARHTIVIALVTLIILLLAAFVANACATLLRAQGLHYVPSSFEDIPVYGFLQRGSVGPTPTRYMTHTSFIMGVRVKSPHISDKYSGFNALRFVTELIPATLAQQGSSHLSPFWAVLFYFTMVLFGVGQQLAIWHCVITGIMATNSKNLKSWETTITFFSCVCGFVLGLPMTTELGLTIVFFLDYCIGSGWWLMVLYMLEITAVFVVRGRPFNGEAVATALWPKIRGSQRSSCIHGWLTPLLVFNWNVILPVALMVLCVAVFKNGQLRELYSWRRYASSYWPIWAQQIGSILQMIILLTPVIVFFIQTWRYLSKGPPDILDRITLLYRPNPENNHQNSSDSTVHNHPTITVISATSDSQTSNSINGQQITAAEDPPPKYTPPPSYTTATGARLAKMLRQSIRRSVRRITGVLGEASGRSTSTLTPPVPPPDYADVLVEMRPTGDRPIITAAEVAQILRSSIRRPTTTLSNNNNKTDDSVVITP